MREREDRKERGGTHEHKEEEKIIQTGYISGERTPARVMNRGIYRGVQDESIYDMKYRRRAQTDECMYGYVNV